MLETSLCQASTRQESMHTACSSSLVIKATGVTWCLARADIHLLSINSNEDIKAHNNQFLDLKKSCLHAINVLGSNHHHILLELIGVEFLIGEIVDLQNQIENALKLNTSTKFI